MLRHTEQGLKQEGNKTKEFKWRRGERGKEGNISMSGREKEGRRVCVLVNDEVCDGT